MVSPFGYTFQTDWERCSVECVGGEHAACDGFFDYHRSSVSSAYDTYSCLCACHKRKEASDGK